MRLFLLTLFLLGSLGSAFAADAVTGRVIKVLPFLLDAKGQDSTTPSLFDRDAYQVYLRSHTNEITGYRIDVLWKAAKSPAEKLKLQVELRGIAPDGSPKLKNFESVVTPGTFRTWTPFTFAGDEFKKFGAVAAWRATLWNGDQLLGEQKSFLW